MHPLGLGLLAHCIVELRDLNAVVMRHVRVQEWWRLFDAVEQSVQLAFTDFQFAAALFHHVDWHGVLEIQIHELFELTVDPLHFGLRSLDRRATFHPQPVHLPSKLVAELLEQSWFHQVVAQRVKDARLEPVATDVAAVAAGALISRRGAADEIGRDHRIAPAAAAAPGQAREQVLRPPPVPKTVFYAGPCSVRALEASLPVLHSLPEDLVDNAKLRNLLYDPVLLGIWPGLPPPGVRVIDEALAIPDQPANVELVVQNARAAFGIAVDRAEPPVASAWGRDAFGIEFRRDPLGRLADGIVAEDAPDHLGLDFVDRPVATHRITRGIDLPCDVVAIAAPATGLAHLHTSALAAPGLVRQILEEQRVHRALEPDVQMRDLTL